MRALLAIIIIATAIMVGCGSQSDEDQVRDTAQQLAADARAHRWGDFCSKTTSPDDCVEALAGAEALGVDVADYVPSDEAAKNMKVTVEGDRATVDATAAKDAEYVRRGDRWLFVWAS